MKFPGPRLQRLMHGMHAATDQALRLDGMHTWIVQEVTIHQIHVRVCYSSSI
jgi:hypothetical protein